MTTTPNLGLTTYSVASGSATTFETFRTAIAGTSSNLTILDTFGGETSASILSLKTSSVINVNASYISTNYYEATAAAITAYANGMIINLKLNISITGATTININGYGNKVLKRVDTSNTIIDFASGNLLAGRYYLFIYDGTYFILLSSFNDQVSISGSTGDFLSISGSGFAIDSGYSYSSFIPSSGSSGAGLLSGSNVWTATNQFMGSIGFKTTTLTGNTTLDNTYTNVNIDATSASVTITLPSASGIRREYTVKKIDSTANVVQLLGTIDNAAFKNLSSQYASYTVYADSDYGKWWIK